MPVLYQPAPVKEYHWTRINHYMANVANFAWASRRATLAAR